MSGWWITPALMVMVVIALWAVTAQAVDPTITSTKVITCDMPVERTDGTPLELNEIAQVRFYVSTDRETWTQAGTNTVCTKSYDLIGVADGTYWYTADVIDTDGRESIKAPMAAELIVKRISQPAPPSGLGWQ